MEGWEQSLHQLKDWVRQQPVEQSLHQLKDWVRQQPVEQIYAALAVLLITFLSLVLLRFQRRARPNAILLAGLSGSGKTVLFYQLRDGSTNAGTVTSMEPNDDIFSLRSDSEKNRNLRPVHLVDVPGHSRLRPKLDGYLPYAAGIIFIVDALDFLQTYRPAAEYLYDVLTKESVIKRKIPVLVLCNKTDKVTAHSKEFIRKQLEKEIEKLRTSRNAVSAADVKNEYTLGVPGQAFAFSQCRNKVTVGEASGLTGDISVVEDFIREQVRL